MTGGGARRQSTLVLALGVACVLVGIAHTVAVFVWNGWPTYGPWLVGAGGLILLGVGWWARRGPPTWPRRNVAWIAGIGVAIGFGGWSRGVGQTERRTFEMVWSYGEPPANAEGVPHVILTYREAPACREGFYSRPLAEYLESAGDSVVTIELELTKDFGKLRGYGLHRLGPHTNRSWGWRYSGCRGNCPSPVSGRPAPPDCTPAAR